MNAHEYLRLWRKKEVWRVLRTKRHKERLERCAALVEGYSFLDVGCALGHSTFYMSELRYGLWRGLDFDEETIIEARERFPSLSFIYSPNCYAIDVGPITDMIDSVVCSEVIEHVKDDRAFIENVISLARIRAVFTTPNKAVKATGHLRCYTRPQLLTLFGGFGPKVESIGPFFYITVTKSNDT